ncbi:protein NRT1/ PTR FAMILY 1.2-like [Corylus avellana]|uniref:protein NRT1/ PTR FAMILY 1.2-like n=1 Tax=Corylus avellana TaxID=13451 RepID=UPI00286C8BF8|nr:protein NRT1/ PTR FAMILY 1.2-like [Corylus avellana]
MDDNMGARASNQRETEQPSLPRKGGFRTMPFIIVNESFEKVASYGLMPNMIFYLMKGYHMQSANGASILFFWAAISNGLAIVGAFLSDAYLGRFRVITIGSFSSLVGMILLWLTAVIPKLKPPPCAESSSSACDSATPAQLFVLLFSFGLISIGAGCIRPCSMAFGADQLGSKDNPISARTLQGFFHWYYVSASFSTVLALTAIVYIQEHLGWNVGFGVPAILMLFSVLMFLLGSSLYVKVKAETSVFSACILVFVAAFRKRNLPLSATNLEYHHGKDSSFTAPTHNLRCLNRACIISDPQKELNPDGSASNPWKLCTIEQVESLKALLRVMPMCSTGIIILLALNQYSIFSVLQASIMDRHLTPNFQIPAGSFSVFSVLTLTIWIPIYDRLLVPLLAKLTGRPRGLGEKTRMGVGLLLSALAMAIAAIVEKVRRRIAIDKGLADKPETVMDMSAMLLIPQFCLFGLAEAFNAIGQLEFYYSQLPNSMSSIALALFTLGLAVANLLGSLLVKIVDGVTKKRGKNSWLSSNLNEGRLDYFFWLITIMCMVNFVYFLVCCWAYGPTEDGREKMKEEEE